MDCLRPDSCRLLTVLECNDACLLVLRSTQALYEIGGRCSLDATSMDKAISVKMRCGDW